MSVSHCEKLFLFEALATKAQDPSGLYSFHRRLEARSRPWLLSEDFLVRSLAVLRGRGADWGWAHDLSLARLTELALYLAGSLADDGRFRAAGDLLGNPRIKILHLRGKQPAIRLKRHRPVSEQALPIGVDPGRAPAWLRDNTILDIRQPALLPTLSGLWRKNPLHADYAATVEQRMIKVSQALCSLAVLAPGYGDDLETRLRNLPPADRRFLKSRLCGFDLARFHELGQCLEVVYFGRDARRVA